jgi:hypothetical protein
VDGNSDPGIGYANIFERKNDWCINSKSDVLITKYPAVKQTSTIYGHIRSKPLEPHTMHDILILE